VSANWCIFANTDAFAITAEFVFLSIRESISREKIDIRKSQQVFTRTCRNQVSFRSYFFEMNSAHSLDAWIQSRGDCVLSGCSLVVIEVLPLANAEKFEEVLLLLDGQRNRSFLFSIRCRRGRLARFISEVSVIYTAIRNIFPSYILYNVRCASSLFQDKENGLSNTKVMLLTMSDISVNRCADR